MMCMLEDSQGPSFITTNYVLVTSWLPLGQSHYQELHFVVSSQFFAKRGLIRGKFHALIIIIIVIIDLPRAQIIHDVERPQHATTSRSHPYL